MPYRPVPFIAGEYFHLVNRGNLKCEIFKDNADRARFLFYLLYLQSQKSFEQPGRYVKKFIKTGNFGIDKNNEKEIANKQLVKIIAFCLMPNHFHILVQSNIDNGVSIYMQKVLNAYTKYFNAKYKQTGHLFSGPFRAVHIENNEQLLYTSAYIHKNPIELLTEDQTVRHQVSDIHSLERYSWSSFRDFINQNRWGKLLDPSIVLDQMMGKKRAQKGQDYKKWVEESGAKDKENKLEFVEFEGNNF